MGHKILRNLFTGKKGTEKPIEIFVALFIILAVSMIMLKMFNSQITEKTTEMKKQQIEADLKQRLDDARLTCKSLCSEANSNSCTKQAVSAYCIKRITNLDLDGNLETGGYDTTLLGGIGVCEDAIYCPMLQECKCGKTLSMIECKAQLCAYWTQNGVAAATQNTMISEAYVGGACTTAPGYTATRMWTAVQFGGTIACP